MTKLKQLQNEIEQGNLVFLYGGPVTSICEHSGYGVEIEDDLGTTTIVSSEKFDTLAFDVYTFDKTIK